MKRTPQTSSSRKDRFFSRVTGHWSLEKNYPVWHPFTQMAEFADPLVLVSGKGSYVWDRQGKRYLDGNSSLWVNLHGHRHPVLTRAITRQLNLVAHTTLLGLANEPSIQLAEALVNVAPRGLSRVFFSDNGATAVEIALKMSVQSWRQTGQPRKTTFVRVADMYHGDTLGAVSVSGVKLFRDAFRPLLFRTHEAPSFHCAACPWNRSKLTVKERFEQSTPLAAVRGTCEWECVGKVEGLLKRHCQTIAGVIVEPKVQAAAGMWVAPRGYLKRLEALCRRYGVHLICDEVAVGFGRTGRMFASQHEGVTPDFMCVAKGLTGGYLPMGATLTTERVYAAFLGRLDEWRSFYHGHSYCGNQLGAAAGMASLQVFRQEKTLKRLPDKINFLRSLLKPFTGLPLVKDVRQCGMMAAVELIAGTDADPLRPDRRPAHEICLRLRDKGIILRPLGNGIPVIPPLSISRKELNSLMKGLYEEVKLWC